MYLFLDVLGLGSSAQGLSSCGDGAYCRVLIAVASAVAGHRL